jgi:hypothetical protein
MILSLTMSVVLMALVIFGLILTIVDNNREIRFLQRKRKDLKHENSVLRRLLGWDW